MGRQTVCRRGHVVTRRGTRPFALQRHRRVNPVPDEARKVCGSLAERGARGVHGGRPGRKRPGGLQGIAGETGSERAQGPAGPLGFNGVARDVIIPLNEDNTHANGAQARIEVPEAGWVSYSADCYNAFSRGAPIR